MSTENSTAVPSGETKTQSNESAVWDAVLSAVHGLASNEVGREITAAWDLGRAAARDPDARAKAEARVLRALAKR